MKHDIVKLDAIIKRVIIESTRKYSNKINEQTENDDAFDWNTDIIDTGNGGKKQDGGKKQTITPSPVSNKDAEGRSPSDKWYGFDPKTKKFISGLNKGKTASEVYPTKKVDPNPSPTPTDDPKYVPAARAKKMYDCKSWIGDNEELYRNLIIGSKPQRIAGGAKSGGIPAIANKQEWNRVQDNLFKLTSNRGIIGYGATFIRESSTEIWRPIFEWVGKNLGGDTLLTELKFIGFDKNKTYAAIAKKYKDKFPEADWLDLTPDEQAERLRRKQQQKQSESFLTPNMSLVLWASIILGGSTLLFKSARALFKGTFGEEFPKMSKLLQRLQRPITEQEIKELKAYIEKQHEQGKITDVELAQWNKFLRQRVSWFNNNRQELNYNLGRWRKGPVAPKSFKPPFYDEYGRRIYQWDGLSVDGFIETLPQHLKQDTNFKNVLRNYEKEVLEEFRNKKYGEIPKTKPKPKSGTTPKPSTPTSTKLTNFKKPPTQTIKKTGLSTNITISNPENITKTELQQIFSEAGYADASTVTSKGVAYEHWKDIKFKFKDGNVALINTHITAGKVPGIKTWQADMKQAFPKKDPARFDSSSYKKYKVEFKIHQLLK